MSVNWFQIPSMVADAMPVDRWNLQKICECVQSEINMGTVTKGSQSVRADMKTLKNRTTGVSEVVIELRTKVGETLRLKNGTGSRFYGWCLAQQSAWQYATMDIEIPVQFALWFDKVAPKAVSPPEAPTNPPVMPTP